MSQMQMFPLPLRSIAFGSITTSYVQVGTPWTRPVRLVKFFNGTDAPLFISWDGTTDHEILPSVGFVLLDVGTNATKFENTFVVLANQPFFVKRVGGAPSSGALYISGYGDKP